MEYYYLKRIESNVKQIIPLKKCDNIIGRGKTCTYKLLDESISRNHMLIKKCDDGWIIKNLSNNGLYLNNEIIKENEELKLSIGCVIRVGHSENFYFRFGMKSKHLKEQSNIPNSISEKRIERENVDGCCNSLVEENKDKLVITKLEYKLKMEEERKLSILKDKEELAMKLQIDKINLERRLIQEQKELESKLSKEKEELRSQLSKLEEERIHLEQEAQNREKFLKLKEREKEELFENRLKEFENLKAEKEKLTNRLIDVESDLEEKMLLTSTLEGELMEKHKLDICLEALIEEKRILKHHLKEAVEKGAQVSDLEESLKLLEAQKLSLEQEVANVASVSETARKEVLESVSTVLENEFQCPICNELFVTAIMLNCSHTFCKYCIDSWKKNKRDCPNCRVPIISETRSLVVDNFIDNIVSTLSEDMKRQRSQLIEERTTEVNAAKALESNVIATTSRSGNGRGRGRGRGGRYNGRGRGATARRAAQQFHASSNNYYQHPAIVTINTGNRNAPPVTISISSDNSDSDSNNNSESYDSSSSSESGLPDVFYGGYGHCFNCGRRGHWANGCPH